MRRFVLSGMHRLCQSTCSCRDGRVLGVVEVSRSIGDGRFKRCGVIATPDVFRCQISDDDRLVRSFSGYLYRDVQVHHCCL